MIKNNQPLTPEIELAHKRDMSPTAIDSRMAAQLPFESRSPRPLNLESGKSYLESVNPKKLKKALAVGALAVGIGAGFVHLTGRAIDQEIKSGEPPVELSGDMHNSTINQNGEVVLIPNK